MVALFLAAALTASPASLVPTRAQATASITIISGAEIHFDRYEDRREHRFELVAGRGADELAGFGGEDLVELDRRGDRGVGQGAVLLDPAGSAGPGGARFTAIRFSTVLFPEPDAPVSSSTPATKRKRASAVSSVAPAECRARAIAAPIPWEAPVTNASFPAKGLDSSVMNPS